MRPDGPLMNLRDGYVMATIAHTRKLRIAGLLVKMLLICHIQAHTCTCTSQACMHIHLQVKMLLICHIQACLLGVSAIFADEKVASWWGTHGYCW